jgi:hypothetical protein
MIRRIALGAGAAMLALSMAATTALAGNPAGTGQPSAECGDSDAWVEAAGFLTGGFEVAEEHYAGEDEAHSLVSGNDSAVSQYDVACYQLTQHQH